MEEGSLCFFCARCHTRRSHHSQVLLSETQQNYFFPSLLLSLDKFWHFDFKISIEAVFFIEAKLTAKKKNLHFFLAFNASFVVSTQKENHILQLKVVPFLPSYVFMHERGEFIFDFSSYQKSLVLFNPISVRYVWYFWSATGHERVAGVNLGGSLLWLRLGVMSEKAEECTQPPSLWKSTLTDDH